MTEEYEPDPRYEWHEVGTWGSRDTHLIRGRCFHGDTTPVESVTGEVVAHLCLTCDRQLPA